MVLLTHMDPLLSIVQIIQLVSHCLFFFLCIDFIVWFKLCFSVFYVCYRISPWYYFLHLVYFLYSYKFFYSLSFLAPSITSTQTWFLCNWTEFCLFCFSASWVSLMGQPFSSSLLSVSILPFRITHDFSSLQFAMIPFAISYVSTYLYILESAPLNIFAFIACSLFCVDVHTSLSKILVCSGTDNSNSKQTWVRSSSYVASRSYPQGQPGIKCKEVAHQWVKSCVSLVSVTCFLLILKTDFGSETPTSFFYPVTMFPVVCRPLSEVFMWVSHFLSATIPLHLKLIRLIFWVTEAALYCCAL